MDKYCKAVLNHLIKEGGCGIVVDFDDGLEKMSKFLKVDEEDLRATVRYLHDQGYIEYAKYQPSGITAGFHLSHKGRYWKHFRLTDRMAYVADKWIDFFTMGASVAALIISVIALLK